MRLGPGNITTIYIIVSCLWITLSDKVLLLCTGLLSASHLHWVSSIKDLLFILITGLFLYRLFKSNSRKLTESEKQYRLMYEESPLPKWMYELETLKFISVNNAAVKYYGYSREEFLQLTILDIRPPEDRQNVIDSSRRIFQNFKQSGIWRHLKKDGSLIYVTISSQQIVIDNSPCVIVTAQDLSENIVYEERLNQLNKNLQEEKRKLSETQQLAKVGGWECYIENMQVVWSAEMYIITQLQPDPAINLYEVYVQHINPDDRPAMIEGFNTLLATGKPFDVTHRITLLTGETRYVRQVAYLEYTNDKKPYKVIGSMQDITELKQLELERNKYLFSLEDTLNSISEGFYTLNKDLVFTNVNKRFELETGMNREQVIGKKYEEVFPGAEANVTYSQYQKALQNKQAVKFEAYWKSFKKWHGIAVYPTEEGVAVYFNDITEKKENELKLKEAVERFETVAKATQDVIYDYDLLKDNLIFNTSITALIGCKTHRVSNNLQWWKSLIHPDDLQGVLLSQQRIIASKGTIWRHEYRIRCGGGHYKYIYSQAYYLYNKSNELVRIIGAVKDIDEFKKVNEENKRLARIITKINNMVVIVDTYNRINWVNKAFEEYTGYTFKQVKGSIPQEFLGGVKIAPEVIKEVNERINRLETFAIDVKHYLKNGSIQWVNVEYTPLFDDLSKHSGYISVYKNITERKQREEKIYKQNRILQEISWLSSHEIRKPVASILGLAYLAKDAGSDVDKDKIVAMINQCAEELDGIVHVINDKISNELYNSEDSIRVEQLN